MLNEDLSLLKKQHELKSDFSSDSKKLSEVRRDKRKWQLDEKHVGG